MEERKIKVQISTEDILKGKFSNTIAVLNGAYTEASQDERNWSPAYATRKLAHLKSTFESDLKKLSDSVSLE